ncbi:putative regulatory subunit of protein kinase a-like protein [Trypanosoma grayi]|uniref:putative regulatory subunit of protein kinase a-like protein n=1 Tax=Trypanosoma grayi TaxID=71804 RepID=UPI0004F4163C|nr:putative regulatory subunit of protein kinase a-like protein [Trypanosoma grayi]KEG14137.1 putative regulatory subunit of protein kinase a-like protein [Trypanosoma grayi]
MSQFDKDVCQWISSASIGRQDKHTILEKIITSIDEYKKVESKGSSTGKKEVSAVRPLSEKKRSSLNSKPKNEKPKNAGAEIDYEYAEVVNKAIYELDHQGMPPLPPPIANMKGSRDADVPTPLNSATRVYRPKNGHNAISASEEGEGVEENGEENEMANGSGQLDEDDVEAMRYGFETFKFGQKTGAGATPIIDAIDFNNTVNTHDSSEDDVLEDGEDERRRRITMKRPSRPGVSALSLDPDEIMSAEFSPTPKSSENVASIRKALESHFLFSFMDDAQLTRVAMVMEIIDFPQDVKIIVKGEPNDKLYLVLNGEATMTIFDVEGNIKTLDMKKGSSFGEIGLMYETESDITVETTAPLTCATLERNTYKILASREAERKRLRYMAFLENVPFLKDLTPQERSKMAEALKEGRYTQGEKIITYGEKGEWLHIIVEGSADVIGRSESGEEEYVATCQVGECVGDLEFLYHHETVADIVAKAPIVRTAKISRRHFERLIGTGREPLQRKVIEDPSYQYYRRTMSGRSRPREDNAPPFDAPPEYLANVHQLLEL